MLKGFFYFYALLFHSSIKQYSLEAENSKRKEELQSKPLHPKKKPKKLKKARNKFK